MCASPRLSKIHAVITHIALWTMARLLSSAVYDLIRKVSSLTTAGQAPTLSRGMPDQRCKTATFHRIPSRARVPVRSTGISLHYPNSSAPPDFQCPCMHLPMLPSTRCFPSMCGTNKSQVLCGSERARRKVSRKRTVRDNADRILRQVSTGRERESNVTVCSPQYCMQGAQ